MSSLFAENLPESVIKRLSIEVKKVHGVNLGQGIPSSPTADYIITEVKKALDNPAIGVYPNFLGTIELRQAIAKRLEHDHNAIVDPEKEILVTVGAMEATATALLSIVDRGDTVGVITPNYCNHFPQIQLARGTVREIPMKEGKTWELDLDLIEQAARAGLKLLLMTNPNNPTGAVFNTPQVKHLVELSKKYRFWLLADETYLFLWYEKKPASLMDFWGESEQLVVIRTFSKEYHMTGWRVGYIVSRPRLLHVFAKTHDALVGTAGKISQAAALAALSGPQEKMKTPVDTYRRRRDLTLSCLSRTSKLSAAQPQGAYYIFPKLTVPHPSVELCQQILQQTHVAVVPGSVFGKSGEGHLRISYAVDDAVLTKGMEQLLRFFN